MMNKERQMEMNSAAPFDFGPTEIHSVNRDPMSVHLVCDENTKYSNGQDKETHLDTGDAIDIRGSSPATGMLEMCYDTCTFIQLNGVK